MARLLICNTCKTVDTLPDFQPTDDPEIIKHDHALNDAIDLHKKKYSNVNPNEHFANIFVIDDDELALIDSSRLEQAIHDNRLEEFLKEERENYKEDALQCYNLHNRPTVGGMGYGLGCSDYRSKGKAIGRTTGIPEDEWTYVCDFCPYHSYVQWQKNKKAGIA